jgi:stalled ribosome rescue protein Dom34
MKVKKFDQVNESDSYIEYTLDDSVKLMTNLLEEWKNRKKMWLGENDIFQTGRLLGAIETILVLNGKLLGGKPYDYKNENFESLMIRMANEFINE